MSFAVGDFTNPLNWYVATGLFDEIVYEPFNPDPDPTLIDNLQFSPVPVPTAVWLFGSGLVALGAVARRRRQAA